MQIVLSACLPFARIQAEEGKRRQRGRQNHEPRQVEERSQESEEESENDEPDSRSIAEPGASASALQRQAPVGILIESQEDIELEFQLATVMEDGADSEAATQAPEMSVDEAAESVGAS